MHRLLHNVACSPSTSTATHEYRNKSLKQVYAGQLDKVNVLGNDNDYGHTGCVNALSWELDGNVLVSGGDDTTLRLWRQDTDDYSTPYPYKETAIVRTGHTGNIFNARLLPSSSRIATVAGDRQVRIFDVERALSNSSNGKAPEYSERETCTRVLKCHSGRTKRIVTEESSDVFLTVAEDGTVRQHDLRTPHQCNRLRESCPAPLVALPHDLSALALSPLSPFMFVVAGESPYGYLFDRRQVGRTLRAEWGMSCTDEHYVTCVRRFGRPELEGIGRGVEHITGARMAQTNGDEVLLSYSADAVYLYSTRDEPQDQVRSSSILSPNSRDKKESSVPENESNEKRDSEGIDLEDLMVLDSDSGSNSSSLHSMSVSSEPTTVSNEGTNEDSSSDEEDEDEDDEDFATLELDQKFKAPIIMPRRRFTGHCNVETVKDVNFIGVEDEFVASGSDDGNFFLWRKDNGRIHGIYEGDQAVVNVIESHPRLPLIACSGIDTTIKLFAPTETTAVYSRTHNAEDIGKRNMAQSRMSARAQASGFARLLWHYRLALRRAAEED